ncbi:hypothetical protein [Alicyclobacillus macrosporangiidus]|uniref:hypothetical protein n=1 Tax=Alicyclobacillus macrosporangiidus TaxID=392015 RepID=UPI0004978DE3|nr:hypothetical protein [Alicyclobacillus macrosporangiidus]
MKTKLATLLAGSAAILATTSFVPQAMAASAQAQYATNIIYNGVVESSPKHTVAPDPWGGTSTSWLPVWYVYTALTQAGIHTTWDGVRGVLSMTAPDGMSVDLSNLPTSGKVTPQTMAVQINGKTVLYAPRLVATDPASGQPTTYVPIYYLELAVKRLGITPGWDGTNWTMTQGTQTPVTQQDMANEMWATFNATPNWDIVKYATMQDAGVTPTPAPVTGGDIANWLAKWAAASKGVTYAGQFHPYDLQYEASSDPFTWARINGLYDGTAVSSASDQINADEAAQIIDNLKWWLNGYKVSNGVYTLHVPFYSNWLPWSALVAHNPVPLSKYQDGMAQATKYFDQVQVWGNPDWSKIYVKLPDTNGTNVTLGVAAKNFIYGNMAGLYPPGPDHGGTTLTISNTNGNYGFMLKVLTMNETSLGGIGFTVGYHDDSNGSPIFTKPFDFGAGQDLNGQSIGT